MIELKINKRKKILIVILGTVAIIGGYLLITIIKSQSLPTQSPIEKIDPVVTADWLDANLDNPNLRIIFVGSGEDKVEVYDQGHIKNSIYLNAGQWYKDRVKTGTDIVNSKEKFEELIGEHGISNSDAIVFYGMPSSAYVVMTLWALKYHGHENVAYLNGGIIEWVEKRARSHWSKNLQK